MVTLNVCIQTDTECCSVVDIITHRTVVVFMNMQSINDALV